MCHVPLDTQYSKTNGKKIRKDGLLGKIIVCKKVNEDIYRHSFEDLRGISLARALNVLDRVELLKCSALEYCLAGRVAAINMIIGWRNILSVLYGVNERNLIMD